MYKTYLFIFVLIFTLSCSNDNRLDELKIVTGKTMGTIYNIRYILGNQQNISDENIEKEINDLLLKINKQMSTYDEESEISLYNKYSGSDWYSISQEFAYVLSQAQIVNKESYGAFDITVGPLVNLWGFGPEIKSFVVPTKKELEEAKSKIGSDLIEVRLNPPAVKKKIKEVYLDLSAIAKGFGVDEIADLLESKKIKDYMIEIGGEVRTSGINQDRESWRIGIERPDSDSKIQKVISISNYSMATSGDYHNYFEEQGKRFSHTIDPRNGLPITHNLASVTVIHISCTLADAYATAIDVLGPESGYNFALEHNLPVYMIIRENNNFIEKSNSLFNRFVK